ncbi:DNA adenine methylase, partial [Turicibacter sanguinis]|nr:DNA adenine methylase [Turicibacter sanguinis]
MSHSYSPLRYPGGKVKLYNYVRDLLKENNLLGETYIEPFAGGAGLALKLLICGDVKRIVIN